MHYDRTTIGLHWAVVALVALLWGLAQIIDFFPNPLRIQVRSLHIALGVALGLVLVLRVVWRNTGGKHLPPAESGWPQKAATATHYLLYLLVAATVLAGLAAVWTRGDSIFGLFSVPAYDPGNKALAHSVVSWHGTIVNLLLILAGLHAAAALFHHVILRDGVLRRMLPGK